MKPHEGGMFGFLLTKYFWNGNQRKGWHGFTVFGKAVLFGHVIKR